ncbi:MAG: hypothetical protein ACRECD_00395 [Burkholderiaceae bacterium]
MRIAARPLLKPALALLCASALLSAAVAHATTTQPRQTKAAAKAEVKAPKAGQTKFYRGSEESPLERERRLVRECQGRPNAGACAGYAR